SRARHNNGGNGPQPVDDLSRLIEPPHMRVAGGENAIWPWIAWVLLDREEQLRHGLIEAPAEEMRIAYCYERRADAGAGTEAQRGLEMLDRDVGLARQVPEYTAYVPTARVVRVNRQGTVDQRHHGADVHAEIGQRFGGIREDPRGRPRPLPGLAVRNRRPSDSPPQGLHSDPQEAADNDRPRPRRGPGRNSGRARSPAP